MEKNFLAGTKWNIEEVHTCDQQGNMRRQPLMDNHCSIVFNDDKLLTMIDNRLNTASTVRSYTLDYDKKLIKIIKTSDLNEEIIYEIIEDEDDKIMIHFNSKNDLYEYFYIWRRI